METKSNIYPAVATSPPHYGDVAAPTMLPGETHTPPAVINLREPNVYAQNGPPVAPILGRLPAMATCPTCHIRGMTKVTHEPSTKTHLLALGICLVGGCLCFYIPYCVDSCKSATHTCPSCGCYIGSYQN